MVERSPPHKIHRLNSGYSKDRDKSGANLEDSVHYGKDKHNFITKEDKYTSDMDTSVLEDRIDTVLDINYKRKREENMERKRKKNQIRIRET